MLTVVTGPPCSGKTTHVQQRALPGDIVVDYDAIAQALGSPLTHGHDQQYRKVATEAREAAITAAVRLHQQRPQQRVWVIDSRPPPSRHGWYARSGATFVALDAPLAEQHARADRAGRPGHYHREIDRFAAAAPDPAVRTRTAW